MCCRRHGWQRRVGLAAHGATRLVSSPVTGSDSVTASEGERSGASGSALRTWQRRALTKYLTTKPRDFLAVATPGAGKTAFALRVAAELLGDRTVEQITVVAPTEHLKHQWAKSASDAGIALDPRFSNTTGGTSGDFQGVVVTYAQVAAHPSRHRVRTENRRTLVVLDEIHHAGDAKTWGDAVAEAFDDATRRLALTGTPFRSDDSQIPFVTYEPDEAGLPRSRADHSYGYSEALGDGVVRPVVFLAYSGEAHWRDSAGEEYTARLGEPLNAEQTARAWRTALDPAGDWIWAVLQAADTRLAQLRSEGVPDAGGLVIATDQERARAYAELLEHLTGTMPALVLSDDPTSSARIAEFATGTQRWMVAVRMVSEGVDVPRLAVGVYATSASTPLYFAQVIGRFVRARRQGETASVFLPSVPVLLDLAAQLELQRDHVIGKPHREKDGLDDDLLTQANKQQDEPGDEEKPFVALAADAELDRVIYDGSSFGTATFSGSAEEADYLGIPGLLDAEQMRVLLRERQERQVAERSRNPAQEPSESTESSGQVASSAERVATADRIAELRRELNSLVAMHHHRTGKPHGVIHGELRRQCGGPPTALATAEQLGDRITALRRM